MWVLVLLPVLIVIQEILPAKIELTMKQEVYQKTVIFILMFMLGSFLPINNILRGIVILASIFYYLLVWVQILNKKKK